MFGTRVRRKRKEVPGTGLWERPGTLHAFVGWALRQQREARCTVPLEQQEWAQVLGTKARRKRKEVLDTDLLEQSRVSWVSGDEVLLQPTAGRCMAPRERLE